MTRIQARATHLATIVFAAMPTLLVPSADAQTDAMSLAEFDRMMEEVSNAGRWGPQDQLGTLNLITPEVRRAAADEVRDGLTVSMSLDVDRKEGPNAGVPIRRELSVVDAGGDSGWAMESLAIEYHGYALSHLDGLGHALYRGRLYNGFTRDDLTGEGALRLGVETMRHGIVTRGVLIDLPRHLGVPYLEPGMFITSEHLEAWERETGERVREGDVLLIRTGRWARVAAEGDWRLAERAAGPHPSLARWLKARGVAVLGGDNNSERYPSIVPPLSPMHLLAIVGMGMPLLDNLDLEEVARQVAALGRPTFMFVGAPLPVVGGVGVPLNPLAIF
jgi:kynurenine formamidase